MIIQQRAFAIIIGHAVELGSRLKDRLFCNQYQFIPLNSVYVQTVCNTWRPDELQM